MPNPFFQGLLTIVEDNKTFEIPGVAGVGIDDEDHDFAQAQLTLAHPLALSALEQTLLVDRLKNLVKVIDITEHSEELAHIVTRHFLIIRSRIPTPISEKNR
jgi:hypothetical protein